jgi:hypothetical protein
VLAAEIAMLNTIDLSELDVLRRKLGSSLFVFRCERLAVAAPGTRKVGCIRVRNSTRQAQPLEETHQGAKNSTKIRLSGLTEDSNVSADSSRTSELAVSGC